MSAIVDNILAYKILSMIVTPFSETDAYKLGIIDEDGTLLIKPKDFTSSAQKEAYTYLHRLCFNMKKIINRMPGGESKTKNIVAAFFLIKEAYQNKENAIYEEKFHRIIGLMEEGYILVEDEIIVDKYLEEEGGASAAGAAPANVTGAAVSTDQPVIRNKKKKIAHIMSKQSSFRKVANL